MADITNPEVIAFANEIRGLAEDMRNVGFRLMMAEAKYAQIAASVPQTNDVIQDGREAEGVSRLTGNDVHALMSVGATLIGTFQGAQTSAVILKPCVRAIPMIQ